MAIYLTEFRLIFHEECYIMLHLRHLPLLKIGQIIIFILKRLFHPSLAFTIDYSGSLCIVSLVHTTGSLTSDYISSGDIPKRQLLFPSCINIMWQVLPARTQMAPCFFIQGLPKGTDTFQSFIIKKLDDLRKFFSYH